MVALDSGLQKRAMRWAGGVWDPRRLGLIVDTSYLHGGLPHRGAAVVTVAVRVTSHCLSYFSVVATEHHDQGNL